MALIALLLAAQSIAADPAAPGTAKSSYRAYRSPSCVEWSKVRTGRGMLPVPEAAYNNWFYGYVYGFNVHGPDPVGDLLGTTQWTDVARFIDAGCSEDPTATVAVVLELFVKERLERRQPTVISKRRPALGAAETCRQWNEADRDLLLRTVWGGEARGYLTAYNRWGPDPSGDALLAMNDDLIDPWISDWCRAHPASPMLHSMTVFIQTIAARRKAGNLSAGHTPANEQVVRISPKPTE